MIKLVRVAAFLYIAYAALTAYHIRSIIFTGLMFAGGAEELGSAPLDAFIPMIFFAFIGISSFLVIGVLAFFLFKQKNRILCLILSAILLIGFPVGTVLGIFTLIVLTRAPVKEQFTG